MARTKQPAKKQPRKKTYDLIIDESIALFNEYGVESVSIYRVAESIGISTGNLTYYFKRKKDLISAQIKELDVNLVKSIEQFPYTTKADVFIQAYADIFTLSWHYRFLFNSAPYLIQNDLIDVDEYEQLISDISSTMANQMKKLIKQGYMEKIAAPYTVDTLVDCIWWQWLGWLRANQFKAPNKRIPFNEILASGIRHSIFITQPYMNEIFVKRLHKAIKDNLLKKK